MIAIWAIETARFVLVCANVAVYAWLALIVAAVLQ